MLVFFGPLTLHVPLVQYAEWENSPNSSCTGPLEEFAVYWCSFHLVVIFWKLR